MRVLSKSTLREFWEIHPDYEQQLLGWYKEFKTSNFRSSHELISFFPNSRSIGANRYIFNIKGNNYRLVVKISFALQTVWVRFIGTHSEYNEVNPLKI